MLTCEVKINGILIHHIYINNRADNMHADDTRTPYFYEIYTPELPPVSGKLIHDRTKGALSLIKKVLGKGVKSYAPTDKD